MNQKKLSTIHFSVLDLALVLENKPIADSFVNGADVAQHAERWGYKRYWLAEHHNMEGVASSATSILIGYIASQTSTIRVGSGGVMLPNHSPLMVAEQFGTLETLYPSRIDLGLGRAPGTDQLTAIALRRDQHAAIEFPKNVQELQMYFSSANKNAAVRAIPGEGLHIPIWILGSSTDSAHLAAALGLPYAFASHFAPALLQTALRVYRENFQPSDSLKEPYAMACVNVVAADTDEEAKRLASSLFAFFLNVVRGTSFPLQPPVDNIDTIWNDTEKYHVLQMLQYNFVGSAATVKAQLQRFINDTKVDELMVVSNIFDHNARVHSYKLIAENQLTKV